MKLPDACLKCGRAEATLRIDERRGVQKVCPCGHSWRPRKTVVRPRQGRAAA